MSLNPALFTSTFADGPDTTKFRPSDLNNITGLLTRVLGGADPHGSILFKHSSADDGVDWLDSAQGILSSAGAGQAPAFTMSPSLTSMALSTTLTVPAMAQGLTSGIYCGSRTLARLFQPALAAGGQAEGQNAFGPGGGNSTMTNGASTSLGDASYNTAMGFDALIANTSGSQNTAYGHRALKANTTGFYNVAIGGGALLNHTTNVGNVAIGTSALLTLTSGNYNTGLGHDALEFLQTGTMNTAVGKRSNWQMTSGNNNTSVGGDSLYSNLTGEDNIAIGMNALYANNANANCAIGSSALVANVSGTDNVAVGRATLLNTTASSFNVAIGNLAGRYQADGSTALAAAVASVYVGYGARGFNDSDNNAIVIGASAIGAGANKAVIGNASVTNVYLGSAAGLAALSCGNIAVGSGATIGWSTDALLAREGAGWIFQRNSTNAQRFSVANSYTSASSYESFGVDWQTTANECFVGTRTGATGTRRTLTLLSQNSNASDAYAAISISLALPSVRIGMRTAAGSWAQGNANAGTFIQLADAALAGSTGTQIAVSIVPTISQSSTAGYTALNIDATESSTGSGTKRLINAAVGGSSKFSVDNAGVLTTAATTFMHSTSASLANGAGAQTGTLTNAPTAGNPTKWIAINDNGTTRYLPAW